MSWDRRKDSCPMHSCQKGAGASIPCPFQPQAWQGQFSLCLIPGVFYSCWDLPQV